MGRSLWLAMGAISGLISVAAGAFGAHALKARLTPDLLQVFETGARYQMVHALLLCLVGVLAAAAWQGHVGPALWGGAWQIMGWTLHPLVLLFGLSGTLMISKTLRIPKL